MTPDTIKREPEIGVFQGLTGRFFARGNRAKKRKKKKEGEKKKSLYDDPKPLVLSHLIIFVIAKKKDMNKEKKQGSV